MEALVAMDEHALLASARQGSAAGFNALIRLHQDGAYNVACRVLGQPSLAADVVQQACWAAYRALPAYRGRSFRAWLLRLVTQACSEELRRRPQSPPAAEPAAPWAHGQGPQQDASSGALASAILALPWEQRVTLVLADLQGLSYQEVAEITGAAPARVKACLGQARARLRDTLAHQVFPPQ